MTLQGLLCYFYRGIKISPIGPNSKGEEKSSICRPESIPDNKNYAKGTMRCTMVDQRTLQMNERDGSSERLKEGYSERDLPVANLIPIGGIMGQKPAHVKDEGGGDQLVLTTEGKGSGIEGITQE